LADADSVWKQIVTTTEYIMWRYNTVAFLLRPKLSLCSSTIDISCAIANNALTFSFVPYSCDIDSIEIPRSLLAGMPSFPPTATVKVLSSIPRCIQVHVEPRNAEDWELLESYAEGLESGLLLKQISVVYTEQCLTLKMKGDQIDILVKKIATNEEDGIACLSESDSPVYGLLLQDTEVIISPKLRDPRETVDWSTPLQLIPCQEDWNEAMLDFHSLMKVSPLEVPSSSVFVSEAIWNSSYDWALLKVNDSPERSQQLVRVISHSSIPNGQAGKVPSSSPHLYTVSKMKYRMPYSKHDELIFPIDTPEKYLLNGSLFSF
jgi:hypothetical protein